MSDASQLPVAVDIQPGEDIASFLQRVANANYLDFRDLTSHRRTACSASDFVRDFCGSNTDQGRRV